KKRLSVE
nr:Chain B, Catenin beta-1 [Homo sapiens]